MGKRELLIIVGFVVVGTMAYWFTAPPASAGEGFSFARLIRGVREEVNPSSASFTHTGRIEAGKGIEELRFGGSVRQLTITGEDRTDLGYEMVVTSSGPDEATATEYAKRTVVRPDEIGDTLTLDVDYPEEASQTAALTLRIPKNLAVRISGRATSVITNVRQAYLESVLGDTTLESVGGDVRGSHRSGRLIVTGASKVELSLSSSRATFRHVRDGLTVTAQSGECEVDDSAGPLSLDGRNFEAHVSAHAGPIRVSASGGSLRVDEPRREVRVDAQRMDVEVSVGAPVAMTIFTTYESLRILLPKDHQGSVDAATTGGGDIQANEFDLTPETKDDESRLTHVFGTREPKIALRNSRGDIVIRRRK